MLNKKYRQLVMPDDSNDLKIICSFFRDSTLNKRVNNKRKVERADGADEDSLIRTDNARYVWKLLGVKPTGHEIVGIQALPEKSFRSLTEEILARNASSPTDRLNRIFRMLSGNLEGHDNVDVDAERLWMFLRSCGATNMSRGEATSLLNLMSNQKDVFDEEAFVALMTARRGWIPGHESFTEDDVDMESERLLRRLKEEKGDF